MKQFFKRNKEIIRIGAMIPAAAIAPSPISWILLAIQLSCFGIMFWIGWGFEYFD